MDNLKNIRWRQRFQNFNKAFEQLERGLAIKTPSDIEQQGIIQSFEFTFELSWKTMKDYLEAQGVDCRFPRDIIKQAFQYQLIPAGDIWLDMLGKRNLLSHTYDEKIATDAYRFIKYEYAPQIKALVQWFREQGQGD